MNEYLWQLETESEEDLREKYRSLAESCSSYSNNSDNSINYIGPYEIGTVHYIIHTVDNRGSYHSYFQTGKISLTNDQLLELLRKQCKDFSGHIETVEACSCPWCSGKLTKDDFEPNSFIPKGNKLIDSRYTKRSIQQIMGTKKTAMSEMQDNNIVIQQYSEIKSAADSLLSSFRKNINNQDSVIQAEITKELIHNPDDSLPEVDWELEQFIDENDLLPEVNWQIEQQINIKSAADNLLASFKKNININKE